MCETWENTVMCRVTLRSDSTHSWSTSPFEDLLALQVA